MTMTKESELSGDAVNGILAMDGSIEPIYMGGRVVSHSDGQSVYLRTLAGRIIRWSPFTVSILESYDVGIDGRQDRNTDLEDAEYAVTCFTSTSEGQLATYNSRGLFELYASSSSLLPTDQKVTRSWKAHASPVMVMQGHPTLPLIATGSADHAVRVWDWQQGACTHHFKGVHGGMVTCLAWHPKNVWLASGAEDGSVAVWDLMTSKVIRVMRQGESHSSAITSLQFMVSDEKDGADHVSWLLSAGRDQVVCIEEILANNMKKKPIVKSLPVLEAVEGAGFLKNHSFIWTAGEKGMIRVWNWMDSHCVWTSKQYCLSGQGIVQAIGLYNSSSFYLSIFTSDLLIFLIEPHYASSSLQRPLGVTPDCIFAGNHGEVTEAQFLNDGRLVVATNSPQIRIHPQHDPAAPSTVKIDEILLGHEEAVISLAHNGNILVSGSRDHCAIVWMKDGDEKFSLFSKLVGHTDVVSAVAIASSHHKDAIMDTFVATASADMTIKLWQIKSNQSQFKDNVVIPKWTVKAHDKDINAVLFTPNGKHLITASQDKSIKIWRVENGQLMVNLSGHRRGVWSIAISPKEQLLASASADKTIKLWSISPTNNDANSCLRTLEGHSNSVLRIAFTKDGNQLASVSSDGIIKIWDVRSGECLQTIDAHADRVWSLYSDGCKKLVTGDASGVIRFWQDKSEEITAMQLSKQDEFKLKEQQLSNLILHQDFCNAAILALELEQPLRLFTLLGQIVDGKTPSEAQQVIFSLLGSCTPQHFIQLLRWIRDWNTNLKRVYISQMLLNAIIKLQPRGSGIFKQGIEVLKSIRLYNDRHYERLDELLQNSHLIDFILSKTK